MDDVQKLRTFYDVQRARATLCVDWCGRGVKAEGVLTIFAVCARPVCVDWRGRGAKTEGSLRFLICARHPLRGSAFAIPRSRVRFPPGPQQLWLKNLLGEVAHGHLARACAAHLCIALACRHLHRALAHAEQVVRKTWAEHLRRAPLQRACNTEAYQSQKANFADIRASTRARTRANTQSSQHRSLSVTNFAHIHASTHALTRASVAHTHAHMSALFALTFFGKS